MCHKTGSYCVLACQIKICVRFIAFQYHVRISCTGCGLGASLPLTFVKDVIVRDDT